jgi:hypothetical protein
LGNNPAAPYVLPPALLNTFFTTLPMNPGRLELFADLSDPINNVVIGNGSGAVWDQARTFVITPDTDTRMCPTTIASSSSTLPATARAKNWRL